MSESNILPSPPPKHPQRYSSVDPDSNPSNPRSAFYQHPSTRSSLERARADSRTHLPLAKHSTLAAKRPPPAIVVTQQSQEDLEKQMTNDSDSSLVTTPVSQNQAPGTTASSSMWPTKQELQHKALMSKKQRMRRNCGILGNLTQRQRTWLRIVLAILVIGAAVGIGVGISLAVGGGVYKSNGQQSKIPSPNKQ